MVKKLFICCKSGFTIVELIIALAMASTVISTVYYFWNFLNMHVYTHSNYAQFEQEAHRVAQKIFSDINKSAEIINWDPLSITFVSVSGDTNRYLFDGDSLLYNDSAIQFLSKKLKVASFSLKNTDENVLSESQHFFLDVSVTFLHNMKDSIIVNKITRTKKPKENSQLLW